MVSKNRNIRSGRRLHTEIGLAFLMLFCTHFAQGQETQDSLRKPATRPPTGLTSDAPEKTQVKRDTIASLTFLTPGTFYQEEGVLKDTLQPDFHQYDPALSALYPMATLGNLGSPARKMYFDPDQPKGIHSGHFAFDLYKTRFEDFRFYDTDVALSRLFYAQGIAQEDGIFKAQFGKNFDQGINFSLNYQRINQEGVYSAQKAKNTAFGVGLMYRSASGRLDGFYHYQSNSIVHEENGELDIPALDSITLPKNIGIILNDALTTHRDRELTVQHHLHLLKARRDTTMRQANVDIIQTFKVGSAFVRFTDANIPDTGGEPDYYGAFLTDGRGVRNFISLKTVQNALDLQFRYRSASPGVPDQLLRAGLELKSVRVDQEPQYQRYQQVFLNAAAQIGISPALSLDGTGYLGILDAAGAYELNANARARLFKDAQTWANLTLYQRNPTLTESRLFISQEQVWQNVFKNVSLNSLQFYYVHPSLRLRLHAGTHVYANAIYFDADRMARQLDQTAEVLQISVSKEVSLGPVGLLAHVMWQRTDAEQLALPQLIIDGQLYYSGRLFQKRLLLRAGFDLLLTDDFEGISYLPVTGQFYTAGPMITAYPRVDGFIDFQVKDIFKAFVKLENLTSYVSDTHYTLVNGHPYFEGYFRFGLWMKLFD